MKSKFLEIYKLVKSACLNGKQIEFVYHDSKRTGSIQAVLNYRRKDSSYSYIVEISNPDWEEDYKFFTLSKIDKIKILNSQSETSGKLKPEVKRYKSPNILCYMLGSDNGLFNR